MKSDFSVHGEVAATPHCIQLLNVEQMSYSVQMAMDLHSFWRIACNGASSLKSINAEQ